MINMADHHHPHRRDQNYLPFQVLQLQLVFPRAQVLLLVSVVHQEPVALAIRVISEAMAWYSDSIIRRWSEL